MKPRSIDKSGNEDFYEKMRTFVASKADLLFSMESKRKVQGGVDYVTHPNQEGSVEHLGTFRSEDKVDFEYELSLLSLHT